jgi:hypothetical protein
MKVTDSSAKARKTIPRARSTTGIE